MVVERSPHSSRVRMRDYVNSPPSISLLAGMGSLIDAPLQRLDTTRIVTGQTVRHMLYTDDHV